MNPTPPHIPGAKEGRVTVAGHSMRYLSCGSGPPLVLLHGLLGYSFSWRFNFEALGQVATVFAPDAIGAGFSDRAGELDCSLHALAERALAFMDALGLRDADLLGTSHGGAVAVFAAALDQEQDGRRIRRLLLVDAVNPWSRRGRLLIPFLVGPPGRLLPWASRTFRGTHGYWLRRQYHDRAKIAAGTLEGYTLPLQLGGTIEYARSILGCWRDDLRRYEERLAKIARLPTLLLWGREDRAVYLDSVPELQKRLPRAQLVVLDEVGHLPYEESPAEFNRVVMDFLRNPR